MVVRTFSESASQSPDERPREIVKPESVTHKFETHWGPSEGLTVSSGSASLSSRRSLLLTFGS